MEASPAQNPSKTQEAIPDIEQRQKYFEDKSGNKDSSNQKSGNKPVLKSQTIGQKLAEEGREVD